MKNLTINRTDKFVGQLLLQDIADAVRDQQVMTAATQDRNVKNNDFPELLSAFRDLPSDYIALDTETTGFITDAGVPDLLTIGIVQVKNRMVHHTLEFKCRPSLGIEPDATAVNGITNEMAAAFPPLVESWDMVAKLIKGQTVIAHNSAFDWRVLQGNAARNGLNFLEPLSLLCTLRMAHPWAESNGICTYGRGPSLDKLTSVTGVENLRAQQNGLHGALLDATQLAIVIEKLRQMAAQ